MPIYEFECSKCGRFEQICKAGDESVQTCPHSRSDCPLSTSSGSVTRLISAAAFHLKGSGWYKTDYSSSNSGAPTSQTTTPDAPTTEAKAPEGGTSGGETSGTKGSSESSSETSSSSGSCSSSCACH